MAAATQAANHVATRDKTGQTLVNPATSTDSIKRAEHAAQALLAAGHLITAESAFRAIIEHQTNNAAAYHGLGMVAFRSGHITLAIDMLGSAIALGANSAQNHCYRYQLDWPLVKLSRTATAPL